MATSTFVTTGGLTVEVEEHPLELDEALTPIFGAIDSRKGAIFSSGFDYPGRHSRWDIGFIDPAIEFISQARRFEVRALNPQGSALLPLISNALRAEGSIESLHTSDQAISGELNAPPKFFPEEKRSRQASVFSVLRAIMQLLRSDHPLASNLGFYGAFGYDLVQQFEEIELHHTRSNEIRDCHLFLPLSLSVVDRKREVAMRYDYSITTPTGPTRKFDGGGKTFAIPAPSGSSEVTCDHAPGEFAAKVQRIIEGTKRGDYFEVVLSQTFSTRFESTPTALFKRLALINPSPYMFLINMGEEQLVGASPELYARVTGDRYETCPIAGTIPRGATALEDAAQVQELMSSRKDESELTMCTDVDRNDMARVCKPGSVRVIGRRQLEFYSHLIHTVDHLEGYLAEGFDALDAFQTHMWACTVTGAPKPAALQEIERLENSPRGWYSGAVGFLSCSGSLNTGITLRTATLRDGRASVRAGATLLFESDPALEEQETRTKAAAFLAALTQSNATAKGIAKAAPSLAPSLALPTRKRVLLVDYKDSFVHNLAAYLRELGADVTTIRAGFPDEMLDSLNPDLVVLSPGPGTPEEFGVPDFTGKLVARGLPVFGVCLGHQGLGQHFGATIAQLPIPEHGKPSVIKHNGSPLFAGVAEQFEAGRYHSLYLKVETVPDCLEIVASTERRDVDGRMEIIPMAVKHRTLPVAGVQFHPESLMTLKQQAGHHILRNALTLLAK